MPRPDDTTTSGVVYSAADYRELFGWRVDDQMDLPIGDGIMGVMVQPILAVKAVRFLKRQEACGPVLDLGAPTNGWIFLTDPNEIVVTDDELPTGVALLACPHKMPLPVSARGPVRWTVRPDVRRRWLPTLSAVLAAVTVCGAATPRTAALSSAATRLCPASRRQATAPNM